MKLSTKKIRSIIAEIEEELLNQTKLPFRYDTTWKNEFPEEPGVYAAFEKGKLVYLGQTAELRSRISDIRRTYNHTLRKKIGLFRLMGVIEKNKFSDDLENKSTQYMIKNFSFTHVPIHFGRLEIESGLVRKYEGAIVEFKKCTRNKEQIGHNLWPPITDT